MTTEGKNIVEESTRLYESEKHYPVLIKLNDNFCKFQEQKSCEKGANLNQKISRPLRIEYNTIQLFVCC